MSWFPFICLGIGLVIGIQDLSNKGLAIVDKLITTTLIVLMGVIGASIGINPNIMQNLGRVGFNCAVLALLAIGLSVVCVVLVEKTVLPLEMVKNPMTDGDVVRIHDEDVLKNDDKTSSLIWIMPLSILTGIFLGYLVLPDNISHLLSKILMLSLIILYIGVGISLGSNKDVFGYIKMLGFRVIFLSCAILVGSLLSGIIGGAILNIPYRISVLSVSGMSYYSLTGAFMTNAYGVEAGTYGFIVNIMREFFTVLFLPILIKVSKGSPIAGGAAGNMDTMLAPITKFVGEELGLVTLITGTILTFAVPFILPLLYNLFI